MFVRPVARPVVAAPLLRPFPPSSLLAAVRLSPASPCARRWRASTHRNSSFVIHHSPFHICAFFRVCYNARGLSSVPTLDLGLWTYFHGGDCAQAVHAEIRACGAHARRCLCRRGLAPGHLPPRDAALWVGPIQPPLSRGLASDPVLLHGDCVVGLSGPGGLPVRSP